MSNGYDEIDDTDDDEATETPKGQTPADLREAAKRGAKAKQEADSLRRENAFLKAGINTDDQRLRYFVKGYDGELRPDEIRKAAVEAGFIAADPTEQQAQEQQQAVADAQRRTVNASQGAANVPQSEADALAQLEAAFNQGGVPAMLEVARQYGLQTTYDGQ